MIGVTRKMILNYEKCGLLTPAEKSDSSGYRYYTADNLTQMRFIRTLQDLGLSLGEIRCYLDDTLQLTATIERLRQRRDQLDHNIARLEVRAEQEKKTEICRTRQPRQTVYCRAFYGQGVAAKAAALREAYLEAIHQYKLNNRSPMFIQTSLQDEQDCLLCIPVMPDSWGENIRIFPEVSAVCVYHRGAYETIPQVRDSLLEYIAQMGLKPQGASRNTFLEGPPNRGGNKDQYITQVSIPVEDVMRTGEDAAGE